MLFAISWFIYCPSQFEFSAMMIDPIASMKTLTQGISYTLKKITPNVQSFELLKKTLLMANFQASSIVLEYNSSTIGNS